MDFYKHFRISLSNCSRVKLLYVNGSHHILFINCEKNNSLMEQYLSIKYDASEFSKSFEIFKLYLFFLVLLLFWRVFFNFHLLVCYADRLEVLISIAPSLLIKFVESTLCLQYFIVTLLNFLSTWSSLHRSLSLCSLSLSHPLSFF